MRTWHRRAVLAFLAGAAPLAAQAPTVRLGTEMNPAGPLSLASTGLLVTVETDQPLVNGVLTLQAPKELRLTSRGSAAAAPATALRIPLGATPGIRTFMVDVHWGDEPRRRTQLKLIAQALADVAQDTGSGAAVARLVQNGRVLTQRVISIDVVRSIDMATYFWFGLIGVGIGWVLRIVLLAQSKVPAPSAAPLAEGDGPITRFIARYYYAVDLGLVLTIGALALLALATDGNPPERTDSRSAALVFGVALGALTNSDLLLKLRR